ncbi:MAG: hypothetical protein SFY96_05825 [Planctomycetota bacterium]|nr:hypothetical protein [Planctomycetota bacterium]
MNALSWRAFLLSAAVASLACGTEPTTSMPDASALAGPIVLESTRERSLIQRDYAGRVRALARHEAIEALDLLVLSADEKEATHALVLRRAKELDAGGPKKIPIILDLQTGVANNDTQKIDDAIALLDATRPCLADPTPLEDLIADRLQPDNATRLLAFVREYRDALVEDARVTTPDASREDVLKAHLRDVRVAEVQASIDRTLGQRQMEFEAVSARLNLTPEQQGKIQRIVLELASANNYEPRGKDVLRAFIQGFRVLTWEQLRELRQIQRERTGSRGLVRDHPQTSAAFLTAPVFLFGPRRRRPRPRT